MIRVCCKRHHFLLVLPNTVFGISLGLAGQAVLWKAMALNEPYSHFIGDQSSSNLWYASAVVYVILLALFGIKIHRSWAIFLKEYDHPQRFYFFMIPHLTLICLGLGMPDRIAEQCLSFLRGTWLAAAAAQLSLARVQYSRFGRSLSDART